MKDPDNHTLDELKDLLLKPEQQQIRHLETRLDDPMRRADEISKALPDAISLSVRRSEKLSRVIQPVIDNSLKSSVRNNPKAIADAIFPALGPGIRKAISATILGMIQSLNQVLNHSFSFKGLKWRFEALRSGKPFAEVVLLNTLVFQVEQIFLIHKKSGIVLEHVVASDAVIQDPDLVSGMLTAIQDFVTDSFATDEEEDIETLRIGSDRTVWIEKGEHALIAAVLRGTPPMDLRRQYQELLETIHLKSGSTLEHFDGDPSAFAVFREALKDGLISQEKSGQKKISPLLWLLFTTLAGTIFYFGFQWFNTQRIWTGYLHRLSLQKGIVILSATRENSGFVISGLKDPLAVQPDSLMTESEKKKLSISERWQPYYSLEPEMVIKRARMVLKPPQTIVLSIENNILSAKGEARQPWIDYFKTTALGLPGIEGIDDTGLLNPAGKSLKDAVDYLSGIRVYFENNRSKLIEGQDKILADALKSIRQIQALASEIKSPVQIVIFGHTDSSGSEKLNLKLSRNRAERIFNYLLINGINPGTITISGIGKQMPLTSEVSEDDRQFNRAVSFKVFYQNPKKVDES